MFRQLMAAVGLVTVKSWTRELDPNRKWLRYDTQMVKGKDTMTKITCEVCQTHQSRLRALRNFSRAFIDGIINGAIKKDTVVKHAKSED